MTNNNSRISTQTRRLNNKLAHELHMAPTFPMNSGARECVYTDANLTMRQLNKSTINAGLSRLNAYATIA